MTVPPLTPPPWKDVAYHLKIGAYIYIALVFLAVAIAFAHRAKFVTTFYTYYDSVVQWLQIHRYLTATAEVYIRYAFHFVLLRMLVSTAICVVYVYVTYVGHIDGTLLIVQRVVGVILLLRFTTKLIASVRPVRFILGGESIMEIFSLACLIMSQRNDWLTFTFLQAYIILSRYFSIEPTLVAIFMPKSSPFHRQLTRLTLEFIVFIYVFACGLQLFERLGEPWENLTGTTFELTIANSFYFTVVTIFTVGYGDFVPFTLLGRLWIIFIIVFGAYLVSQKIGQVVDVLSGLRRGLGSFVKAEGVDHCVVCGNIKWEYLKSFVQEFYGDERNGAKKLVVICDKPKWSEETWNIFFSSHAHFKNNVTYLEGSCVSRDDLIRAQVETAKAVFVLNNQHNYDPYAEDSETLKRILTIRSYTPQLPIYSMCALRDSLLQISYALEHQDESEVEHDGPSRQVSQHTLKNDLFPDPVVDQRIAPNLNIDYAEEFDDDDGLVVPEYDGTSDLKSEAICMQEVEMSVLAENVFCNGLSTLLANLVLQVNPVSKPTDPPWAIEYKIGAECRFEYVKMPLQLHDKKYSDIAVIMYDYGVLMIATKRYMDSKWKAVTSDTVIDLNTIGLVITYHSTQFLGFVMTDVANKVRSNHGDTDSGTSQDVPSIDEDFPQGRDVPRHSIAGDRLTGDLSVMYESGDEFPPDLPMYPSSYPFARAGPSLMDEGNQHTSLDGQRNLDLSPMQNVMSTTRPTGSNEPQSLETFESPHETRPPPLILTHGETPEVDQAFAEDSKTAFGLHAEVHDDEGTSRLPLSTSVPSHVSTENLLGTNLASSRVVPGRPARTGIADESSDEIDSDVPNANSRSTYPAIVESLGEDKSTAELTQTLQERQKSIESRQVDDMLKTGLSVDLRGTAGPVHNSNEAGEETDPMEQGDVRQKRGSHRVSFPNQAQAGMIRFSVSEKPRYRASSRNRFDGLHIFNGAENLPLKVKGHIVVCTIGRMGVRNLKHFLQRVWVRRGISAKRDFDGKTTVVAICQNLSEEDEAELSVFPQDQLFVIRGNSLSVKTLKKAQYDQARAIIILACEDKDDEDHMDAKAIFTIMTLDYLLGEKSDTFVCSMLDAEESMQLLRAPSHARRRGTMLGRAGEEFVQFEVASPRRRASPRTMTLGNSYSATLRQLRSGRARQDQFNRGTLFGARALSFGPTTAAGLPGLPHSMSFIGVRNSTYSDRREAIGRLVVRDRNEFDSLQQFPTQTSFGAFRNQMEDEDDNLLNQPSALNFLWNPSNYTMGAPGLIPGDPGYGRMHGLTGPGHNRARDESFEKQRYASGEMMISSTYISLLIREYAMPGLMAVVRKIFGAGVGKNPRPKPCWIRNITVPQKWIRSAPQGRRTYRELFELLNSYGAIALGLYRSGDAPVRVEFTADGGMEDESDDENPSLVNSDGSRFSRSSCKYSRRSGSRGADSYDSAGFESDDSIALGGENPTDETLEQAEETSSLLQNLPSYGTMIDSRATARRQQKSPNREVTDEDDDGAKLDIPAGLLFDMAEDVHTAQQGTQPAAEAEEGDPLEDFEYETYTCPTHGRVAKFREVPGGDNVLPYVYTNPEAYTLVSEHDAVYVLVPPTHKLPEPDEW